MEVKESTLELPRMGRVPEIVRNHTLDSTRWNRYLARDGDVIIATWAKAGTTWVQQIIAQLILGTHIKHSLTDVSPWIENRHFPLNGLLATLEAQQHQRFLKTHLPATALAFRESTRYIFIGRDGRDVVWSWYNHHRNLSAGYYEFSARNTDGIEPKLEPPIADVRRYFLEWLERDGFPLWPFWPLIRSWWSLRGLQNVLVLHYTDLRDDPSGSVERIARFIGRDTFGVDIKNVVRQSSFAYMKENAEAIIPGYSRGFAGGSRTFLNRGVNGAWRASLHGEDISRYEQIMRAELGADCAAWLSRA